MNNYQTQLWKDLIFLVNNNEAFYYTDQKNDNVWFRIFNYRLASYTDFCQPNALECRGTTFEITEEGENAIPVRLASHPFEKFFNLYENPMTMNLDLSTVDVIEDKADGSLITTYLLLDDNIMNHKLRVKSKGSLHSDHTQSAFEFLKKKENLQFASELLALTLFNKTVIMEWIAPTNRIVLPYENEELRVLGIRDNDNGQYYEPPLVYPEICKRWTKRVNVDDPVQFVASIPEMQNIEGYVVRLASGQRVKIKTTWYLTLHRIKNDITSPRRLFEAVLEETTDDMKSLFHDDPTAIQTILKMEKFVEKKYNHMVNSVEQFYTQHKHLDRKKYAVLGQKELNKMCFVLSMNKYNGKEFSYKEFLKKQWKRLGLKDEVKNE